MMVSVIILAAGKGSRMGSSLPKQFMKIGSDTILKLSTKSFIENDSVDNIILVVPKDYVDEVSKAMLAIKKKHRVVAGGKTRLESARMGLDALENLTALENTFSSKEGEHIVLVHDGARPYVSKELINRVIKTAVEYGAAVPAIALADTVRKVGIGPDESTLLSEGTLDRDSLRAIQTPQGFSYPLLKRAYSQNLQVTDDASLVEKLGEKVYILEGEIANKKITTVEDLPVTKSRIGIGHDTHKLAEGRDLILGGVAIEHDKGLMGHSDADVLTHAVMDAILGALALGDIGSHFPDTDKSYEGISSISLLDNIMNLTDGYRIVNLDTVIFAERPKILPYISRIRESLSQSMGIDIDNISVKATTGEGLGYIGRQEGISAQAIVLMEKI